MTNSDLSKNGFWAVTEEDGGILISRAGYHTLQGFDWFMKLESDNGTYICFFPYISTFFLSLEIRSNDTFAVTKEVEETALDIYPGATPLGFFESGPIVGLFPYDAEKEVSDCTKAISSGLSNVPLKEKALWAIRTGQMIQWLKTGMPVIRTLPSPREMLGI